MISVLSFGYLVDCPTQLAMSMCFITNIKRNTAGLSAIGYLYWNIAQHCTGLCVTWGVESKRGAIGQELAGMDHAANLLFACGKLCIHTWMWNIDHLDLYFINMTNNSESTYSTYLPYLQNFQPKCLERFRETHCFATLLQAHNLCEQTHVMKPSDILKWDTETRQTETHKSRRRLKHVKTKQSLICLKTAHHEPVLTRYGAVLRHEVDASGGKLPWYPATLVPCHPGTLPP